MEQSKLKEFTCLFTEEIANRLGLCCAQEDGDRLESERNCGQRVLFLERTLPGEGLFLARASHVG